MSPRIHCRFIAALLFCASLAACGPGSNGAGGAASAPTAAASASASASVATVGDGLIRVAATSPLAASLQVAAVQQDRIERPISVPAVIESDPARVLKVIPPLAGRIVRVHKQLGDAVKPGDALFTVDSADLAQAFSDATKAQAALGLAQRNLQRQTELSAAEISARKDLEQAQSDAAQAGAEATRTQSRLAQLGTSLQAGKGREYTLRSPIGGHVVDLTGAQGGFWNDTNAALMTVADLSQVWVTASVQEKDLAAVFVGQPAQLTLNAYPGERFAGKVKFIGEMLDADTRTVKVRITVDNAAGRFRPGMFAGVVFSGQSHTATLVPAAALVQGGFNTRVLVERSEGVFEPRVVTTGAQIGGRVEVLTGLKPGERIVVKDAVLIHD